jgi:L-fuconate dehydratase
MNSIVIREIRVQDMRFSLQPGEGADAVHRNPQYSFAVTELCTDTALSGTGLTLTMGAGNDVVCATINLLAAALQGREIEELMADFGSVCRDLANHHQLRWLGPHKGVIHLALASIVNACFDLWAKKRGVPLWKLLLDLDPGAIVRLLDLTYVEDVLTSEEILHILQEHQNTRNEREGILRQGYPGYDTSVGWIQYDENRVREKAAKALDEGFQALKLKVGSSDEKVDIRRATALRSQIGDNIRLMLDANQQWSVPQAIGAGQRLRSVNPFWIEEPTHPDDVFGHQRIARELCPIALAVGEHVPNRVAFKNYLEAKCIGFIQVDCTRVAGVSEFITVSLLARKLGVPVVPHIGDLGQIHQHLVLFNHVALGHPVIFLEYIPHLRHCFVDPVKVQHGVYVTPQSSGCSSDFIASQKA